MIHIKTGKKLPVFCLNFGVFLCYNLSIKSSNYFNKKEA